MDNFQYYLHADSCNLYEKELRFDVLPNHFELTFSIDKICFNLTRDLAKRRFKSEESLKLEKYLRLYRDYALAHKS